MFGSLVDFALLACFLHTTYADCNCGSNNLQQLYCDSEFAILSTIAGPGFTKPSFPYLVLYTAQPGYHIFKASSNANNALMKKERLRATIDCYPLFEKNTKYLVMGKSEVYEQWTFPLVITKCPTVRKWSDVTPFQQFALMTGIYDKFCDCQVKECTTKKDCKDAKNNLKSNQCLLERINPKTAACYDNHGICRKPGKRCKWEQTEPLKECLRN